MGGVEESLPGAEVTSIGLEFGTVELLEVLDALRGDNWLYARGLKSGLGMDSALARGIKKKARDALYVDTDDWKEKVYARTARLHPEGLSRPYQLDDDQIDKLRDEAIQSLAAWLDCFAVAGSDRTSALGPKRRFAPARRAPPCSRPSRRLPRPDAA